MMMRELKVRPVMTERDDDVIARYFQDISRYHPLSGEEEVRLAQLIRAGDRAALQRLVKSNLRFVVSVAKQYQHRGLPLTDLIAEGNLGLMEAARQFDETRGFKFISYAVWWIRAAILKALEEQPRVIRIPKNQVENISQVNKQTARLEQLLERLPTEAELSEALGLAEPLVNEALYIAPFATSYDLAFPNAEDGFGLLDVTENPSEPADQFVVETDRSGIMADVLADLSERERQVILLGFGFTAERALNDIEVGQLLGLSPQLVQKARSNALIKLRTFSAVTLLS